MAIIDRLIDRASAAAAGGVTNGYVDGFLVKYQDSTRVIITSGIIECDGLVITITVDTTSVTVVTIPFGFDIIYFYIDKSLSSASSFVSYDDVTEPVYSPVKRGWYHPTNTSDRMIGCVFTLSGEGAIIHPYTIQQTSSKLVRMYSLNNSVANEFLLASGMDPTGVWQAPNIRESSTVLPVNAQAIKCRLDNSDAANTIVLLVGTDRETATFRVGSTIGYQMLISTHGNASLADWIALGASRNISVGGADDDDNNLSARIAAVEYSR